MVFQEYIGLATGIVGFIAAIAKLISKAREMWAEVRKLREGVLSTNATVAQLSQRHQNIGAVHIKPDTTLVFKWAHDHRAANPYDLGPKNWERCLHDLGYPGGRPHELIFDDSGALKYQ